MFPLFQNVHATDPQTFVGLVVDNIVQLDHFVFSNPISHSNASNFDSESPVLTRYVSLDWSSITSVKGHILPRHNADQ